MASDKQVNNQRNLNSETEKTLSLEEELLRVLQKRRGVESNSLSDNQDINNVLQDQIKQLKFQNNEKNAIRKLSNSVLDIASKTYAVTKDQLGLETTEKSLKADQAKLDKNIILLKQQQKKLLTDTAGLSDKEKQRNIDIANSLGEQIKEAGKLKQEISKVEGTSKAISENFGVKSFSKVADVIKDIPGIGKLAGPLESAAEGARNMASNIQDAAMSGGKGLTKEKIKQLGLEKDLGKLSGSAAAQKIKGFSAGKKAQLAAKAGFKALGPIISKAFGPAAIILELVKAFKLIDGESGKVAKQLGVSAAEGRSLVRSANATANGFEDILVSGKDIVAAQLTLNKQFGTAVQFSGQFAAEFAQISERTGLSAEAMGFLAENALIVGGSIKDQLTDITATTMELNAQSGISLSTKEIQEGVAKASAAQVLSAGRNTKELANQVYQAKLLGVEQSKVESIADSLLNFEDSIAKELEAELLLGKDLNLEKARQAALDNDIATLASEIKDQVGSAAEFGEMNRIEQEAIAAAVGMTKDELASALVEQEKLVAVQQAGFASVSKAQEAYNKALKEGNLTQELRNKLTDAGVLAQFESATAQEKLTAVTEKLQGLFVSLVEPLMPIFDVLMQIVESAINPLMKALGPILQLLGDLLGGILKPIADILAGIIEPVFQALAEPINMLNDAFGLVKDAISEIFPETEGMGNMFKEIGGIVGKAIAIPFKVVGGLVSGVVERVKGMIDIFKGVGKIISGDFLGGFEMIGAGVLRIMTAPAQAIVDIFRGVINGLIDMANAVIEYIPGVSAFEQVGEFNIADTILGVEPETEGSNTNTETPPSVGLATGGIVTAPTTALIGEGGEPEAVVPLSKASSMGFGGSERTIQLLERLVTAVERGGVVELDGNKVGTALGLVSYKTQ